MIDTITTALSKKFSNWLQKEIIVCQDVKSLAVIIAGQNNDKITYPLFSLLQARPPIIKEAGKTQMSAEGLATGGGAEIKFLRLVPVTLSYAFIILASSKSTCLDLWQQIIAKLINNPGIEVEIPYSDMLNSMGEHVKRTHWFGIQLTSDSSYNDPGIAPPDQLLNGNIHGMEIGFQILDAYIMFDRIASSVGIESVQVGLKGDVEAEVELVWSDEA
jgi:hypothetical protein